MGCGPLRRSSKGGRSAVLIWPWPIMGYASGQGIQLKFSKIVSNWEIISHKLAYIQYNNYTVCYASL